MLSEAQRTAVLRALFSDDGLRYGLNRMPIGSSDFAVQKTHIFCAIYTEKTIILPRQARDKHRESTQKRYAFFAGQLLLPGRQPWRLLDGKSFAREGQDETTALHQGSNGGPAKAQGLGVALDSTGCVSGNTFLHNFHRVCPEPVLVKFSVLDMKTQKRGRFYRVAEGLRTAGSEERRLRLAFTRPEEARRIRPVPGAVTNWRLCFLLSSLTIGNSNTTKLIICQDRLGTTMMKVRRYLKSGRVCRRKLQRRFVQKAWRSST